MFKIFLQIRKKPGMSREDFIAYYENHHAPLAIGLIPSMRKYLRHYLQPLGSEFFAAGDDRPDDVITEIWFDSRAGYDEAMALLADPEKAAILAADEEKLFDRASIRVRSVECHESELTR